MKHIKEDGQNDNLFILLHGTGGDAQSLLGVASRLDPDATMIGIEGEVVESGMKRYFARYPDGSFDLKSLDQGTEDLYETIEELRTRYDIKEKRVILLGYSNGANILQSILKTYETDYRLAILLHPSSLKPEQPFKKQKNLKALVTSGDNDPYITPEQFRQIEASLKEAEIPTEVFTHGQGHTLIPDELTAAGRMIAELDEA